MFGILVVALGRSTDRPNGNVDMQTWRFTALQTATRDANLTEMSLEERCPHACSNTPLLVCSAHAAVTARLLCRPEEELSSSKLSMQPRICRPDLESPPALSSLSVSLLPPRLLCPLSSITRTRRPSRPLLFCCRLKQKGKEVTRGKEMTSFLPLEKKTSAVTSTFEKHCVRSQLSDYRRQIATKINGGGGGGDVGVMR